MHIDRVEQVAVLATDPHQPSGQVILSGLQVDEEIDRATDRFVPRGFRTGHMARRDLPAAFRVTIFKDVVVAGSVACRGRCQKGFCLQAQTCSS